MRTVGALMTSEVSTVGPDVPLLEAIGIMARRAISCVVVRDGPPPIGVVTERDLARKLLAAGWETRAHRRRPGLRAPGPDGLLRRRPREAVPRRRERDLLRRPPPDQGRRLLRRLPP